MLTFSELGIVAAQGVSNLMAAAADAFRSPDCKIVPDLVRLALAALVASLHIACF